MDRLLLRLLGWLLGEVSAPEAERKALPSDKFIVDSKVNEHFDDVSDLMT